MGFTIAFLVMLSTDLTASVSPAQTQCTAPLELTTTGSPVTSVRVNGRSLTFLVDTGAASTLLNASTAKSLDVRSEYTSNRTLGIGGRGSLIQVARHVRIELAGATTDQLPLRVTVLDLPLRSTSGAEVVGILGSDWLRGFDATIDYKERVLKLPCVQPVGSPRS